MGQGAEHSRGAGARIGRGQPCGLCADDHRPRPAALQPAVRALPEPRARVDAGLRHRLLHGPAGRGHHLRPEPLRPRQGGPDHHLRRASVEGGGARRGARASDALRAGGPSVQADPAGGGEARLDHQGAGRRAAPARGGEGRGRGASAGLRRADRGAVAQRLDPCGRGGDRRPAAGRAGAAVSGPALGHAGHPVQHEMGRGGGAGEVRLPGAEDADGHPERARPLEGARDRDRHRDDPAGRSEVLRALRRRQDRRRLPGGKLGHDGCAAAHEANLHRGYRGAGGALPSRPDGEHPGLLRGEERAARRWNRSTPRSTTS